MIQTVTVLCSNNSCIYNSECSYYGVCKHPTTKTEFLMQELIDTINLPVF